MDPIQQHSSLALEYEGLCSTRYPAASAATTVDSTVGVELNVLDAIRTPGECNIGTGAWLGPLLVPQSQPRGPCPRKPDNETSFQAICTAPHTETSHMASQVQVVQLTTLHGEASISMEYPACLERDRAHRMLRAMVAHIHIQPNAGCLLCRRAGLNVPVKDFVEAPPPVIWVHIHALYPPQLRIAPAQSHQH